MEFMSAHFNGQSSNAEVVGVTFEICYYQFADEIKFTVFTFYLKHTLGCYFGVGWEIERSGHKRR